MSQPNYMIITGYHSKEGDQWQEWFWRLWLKNTLKYCTNPPPREIVVYASGGRRPTLVPREPYTTWVNLHGDLGFCGDVLHGKKPYRFCGSTAGIITFAMLCYLNECDCIYKEQDCLAFGPYIETMYREIGNHGCIFGPKGHMPSSQTIMLIKHAAIPEVASLYLSTPAENQPQYMGECKFATLLQQRPDLFCTYSFGYDRVRPFNMKDPVWYGQKFTPNELRQLGAEGMIDLTGMPEVKVFSNGA